MRKKMHQNWKLKLLILCLALCLSLLSSPTAIAVDGYGDVFAFGHNSSGTLGLGDTKDRFTPSKIEGVGPIVSFSASGLGRFSLIVNDKGEVYSFGSNFYGQLGHGDTKDRTTPARIKGLGAAKAVSAGSGHSLVLLDNGDVYSFGFRTHGQLGHNASTHTTNSPIPAKIEGLGPVQAVAAGHWHSLMLLENGDVYSSGRNSNGELGLGQGVGTGTINFPVKIEGLGLIKAISAGQYHSLVLTNTGEVYAFGENKQGQLGLGDTNNRFTPTRITGIGKAVAIAAGGYHSLVILENGDVLSFGRNNHGQLGVNANRYDPTVTPTRVEGLGKAQAVSAGREHSLVLLENGDVYGFGRNNWGELGWNPAAGRHPAPAYNPIPNKIAGLGRAQAVSAGYNYSLVLVGIEREISVNINNKRLHTDVPPVIINGRTMVPLRAIFEALDMEVEWIAETRTIVGTKGSSRIQLTVDSIQSTINGSNVTLDVPATVIEGRTLVPVRFIAESTGQQVGWDARTRTVNITSVEPGDWFRN